MTVVPWIRATAWMTERQPRDGVVTASGVWAGPGNQSSSPQYQPSLPLSSSGGEVSHWLRHGMDRDRSGVVTGSMVRVPQRSKQAPLIVRSVRAPAKGSGD